MQLLKPHILFVDDDSHFLDGIRRMLNGHRNRWEMTFVTSVDEALKQVESGKVDTIISDVMLPGKGGFDLLKEISDLDAARHVPVILMTGADEREFKRRALDLGATDLLSKPIDPEDLIARLRNALRLKAYEDEIFAHNEILEQKVQERTSALNASRLDLIWRLAKIAEFRDEDTGNHILRVGSFSRVLAEAMGLSCDRADMLFVTSPLHDIGKIGIPDKILLKPGKLNPQEWTAMKQHCALGAQILRHDAWLLPPSLVADMQGLRSGADETDNPLLRMASTIASAHHEWWDGTGYPKGLSGEAIPLEARIVAVADVYDALFSVRPYKVAFPEEMVLAIMKQKVGKHFDPEVYDAFAKSVERLTTIRVKLADRIVQKGERNDSNEENFLR